VCNDDPRFNQSVLIEYYYIVTPSLTHPEGSYTFKDGKIIQDIARSSYIDPKIVCTKQ
jgi:hypothetical protein